MSRVTNIILTTGACVPATAIRDLNNILKSNGFTDRLTKVDNYAFGSKSMECEVYIAAINYLETDWFVNQVRSLAWNEDDRKTVQLFINEQEEYRFTEYSLL
jgi:hypothetical protein